jgi:3-oxoacyl-[acyl-carrier protein] reductase
MQLDLTNRTALVTAASAGIGVAIARGLAREGVRLAITARRKEAIAALAAALEVEGNAPVTIIPADITAPGDLTRIDAMATEALGHVDILVNSAGASRPTTLDAEDAVWDDSYALNFSAVRRLTHRLVPGMQARGWGRVINISGSSEPRDLNAAAAAKGALHLWAKGVSCLVAKDGITINTIAPGRIWSEQVREKLHPDARQRQVFIEAHIPLGRFGEPEELAALATFLASPLASYITGTVIPVDGGMRRFAI